MLNTYKATLRGNHLEWNEEIPDNLINGEAVQVYVTIVDKAVVTPVATTQGERMAEALEQLAASNALSDLTDPIAWEREIRQERSLPDRDGD